MAKVSDYYPGDFWGDVKQTLAWIYSRQNAPIAGWQGNALATPTTSAQFAECGIVSTPDFSTFAQTALENIVIDLPVGVLPDASIGPDGFPINFSPQGLPQGNILLNTFQNSISQTVSGRCFSLLQVLSNYRVDVFSRTDKFYYQGSSSLTDVGSGNATWSVSNVAAGAVMAVLYPTTVPQPGVGSSFSTLPAGWLAHSNMGVGKKLSNYFARVFSKTDIEYLQEDNIPLIIQDAHHARCGSSVVPAAGTLTVHVLTNDPVAGVTNVFNSLQSLAAFKDLPRSLTVPTSDPLYVPDVTLTNVAILQNRCWIYDAALFILACCSAGNFTAAAKVIKRLNNLLDNPGYLASLILENAEDGSTARWTPVNGTVTNVAANSTTPQEPPYGTGNVIKFHANVSGATFTYAGTGFPDNTDTMLSFEHFDTSPSANLYSADIGVTSSTGKVTDVQVNNNAAGAATYNSATKTIIVPIGFSGGAWRTTLQNLQSLVNSLTGDNLSSITNFKVTLNYAGDFYLDNLSVGTLQPANSLSFSYDIYYGQIDQAYIRAGAMAWVCYAYAIYMQTSLDYTPALYLQKMLNFILTLQSTASDLTNGLFYLGYGKYQDPGYQFVPGRQTSISTEHNVDLYFAFKRAAKALPTAATQLLKTGTITGAQASSLNSTAASVSSIADTLSTQLTTNIYTPPSPANWAANTAYSRGAKVTDSNGNFQCCVVAGTSGGAAPAWSTTLGNNTTDNTVTWELVSLAGYPGHFAQGANSTGLDTSQALDAAGTWAALFCHAIGDDTKATECLKFVYQKFYLTNMQILLSSASASYNQAYQQLQTFNGFKPYNDSTGGYSGSPASVWQEGSWGMILALLRLHDVSTVASYFASVETSIDAFLTKLVTGERVVRSTTGDGSLLNYSLAARGLPYEFTVWPGLSSTAWFWLTSMNPSVLLATDTDSQSLPYLFIPHGQGQTVLDREGHSSIATLQVQTIDPGGVLKGLASQQNLVGKVARLKLGFPSQSIGDFVTLHTVQVLSAGATGEGRMVFDCADIQRFMKQQLWMNGGPSAWTPGQTTPAQPVGKAFAANAFAVSDKNPRYLQGNPLDIYLAAMQNELGVGQDPALPQTAWTLYQPGNDSTLINPNPYLEVNSIRNLRDTALSGDRFEFKITRPVEGKQWLEDQILKVLGLYTIVGADGKLRLKSMKSPQSTSSVMAFNEKDILGIPEVSRLSIVNVVTVRMGVDVSVRETAGPEYRQEITFQQVTSLSQFKQQFKVQVEANGLQAPYGGNLRGFLLADRIFKRYAFATPKYRVQSFLSTVPVELGDFVWLNHPLVPDLLSGGVGLTNVVCEVISRQPNYAAGRMEFELMDTRFMNLTTAYQIAPLSAAVPNYSSASASQRKQYMFISFNSTGGLNADGTPGNTIF